MLVFVVVSVVAFAANITCDGGGGLCEGTGDPDTINGSANADIILADNGSDSVNAGDSNDVVDGDEGNDTLNGEGGNDYMTGAQGNDTLNGGTGNDQMFGGQGNDTMSGNDDDDLMVGNAGNDTMDGGANNDTMLGQSGNDSMSGGSGNDLMRAGGGNDTLNGNGENDIMSGGPGNDTLNGGDGDDFISGGAGSDTTNVGKGLDTYDPDNPGPDVFFVNAGDVTDNSTEFIKCGGGRGPDRVIFSGNIVQSGSSRVFTDGATTGGAYDVATDCEQVFLNGSRVLSESLAIVPASFSFEAFTISSGVLTGDSVEFIAEGYGVTELKLQIFSITGRKLAEQTEKTNYLEFEAMSKNGDSLANGLYLYTLIAKGTDGKVVQSGLRKLVIQR
jgi:Ca2+-binding RTX toxin-like protein